MKPTAAQGTFPYPHKSLSETPRLAWAGGQRVMKGGWPKLPRPLTARQAWCGRCARDNNEDCPILAATFVYDATDPEYPKEWHYERGGPACSAFEANDPLDQPFMRQAAVLHAQQLAKETGGRFHVMRSWRAFEPIDA